MSDHFHYTSPLDPLAAPLLEQLTFEYDSRYGSFFDAEGAKKEINRYPAEVFQPPHGNFLLLLREGRAIAGGAFMAHADEGTAEFKRIWTDATLRRQGLARKVLLELEAQAIRQGYHRVYLTTGFRQPEAVGLYLTNGYTALFDTTAAPETIVKLPFEKHLKVERHRPAHSLQRPVADVRPSA
ncbi:Acetyltransferase (GNAT) family protein [Rhizobium sp. RU35A]|uniref:GNAT family N-acetyltransferase n=1 Tax=Rhizobium straminoryzae TaxID=1387186 RepID=A0A549TH71_9HYPH|nr:MULTISPECIES: GNAT family N-acetyltransferase [Rhizobium]TRL42286.1 GNAT family N-acetyltransferase [Rhizobium straminoryzae]SIQ96653.1 Acetyltransferase (GNAT) family protein [Rhizobium sp. RU35A]